VPSERGVGKLKDLVWDDVAFKERVKAAARRKGITVREALEAAGVSPYYLKKTVEGRSSNTLINLARVLDMPPAEMCGFSAEPNTEPPRPMSPPPIDGERLKRITLVAQTIAAQLAALLYVVADRSDVDPAVLVEKILHEIGALQHTSVERGGSNK
jgi:transcriptional regulator with XRE-family HTH domain